MQWEKAVKGTTLHDLIQQRKWDKVIRRCSSSPTDVNWRDKNNNSALHLAVTFKPPLNAIIVLVASSPDIIKMKTSKGETPLHLACSKGASPEVISYLIESYPGAVSIKDSNLRTPLHSACSTTSTSGMVISALLNAHPSTVDDKDSGGKTPLKLLQECHEHVLSSRPISNTTAYFLRYANTKSPHLLIHRSPISLCWDSISQVLMATYHKKPMFPVLGRETPQVLHAAAAFPECYSGFFQMALKVYPQQAKEKDENGNLPLHIVASTPSQFHFDDVISALLTLYPDAAKIPNDSGVLPLKIAIDANMKWGDGVKRIIDCNPEGFAAMAFDNKHYPEILARLAKDCIPNSLFVLFKNKPELMKTACIKIDENYS